jgi:hypothetical protein
MQAAMEAWEAIDSAVLQNLCAILNNASSGASNYNRGWLVVIPNIRGIRRVQKAASKD